MNLIFGDLSMEYSKTINGRLNILNEPLSKLFQYRHLRTVRQLPIGQFYPISRRRC